MIVQILHRHNVVSIQYLFRDTTNPWYFTNRQRSDKFQNVQGIDKALSIGLVEITGNLGQ